MTVVAERPVQRVRPAVPVWLSLAALALGGFGIGTTEFATMGILVDVGRDLGATVPQSGRLVSAYALGVVVGAPLLAVLGARLPRKALLLLLLVVVVATNALSAVAPSIGTLVAARFLTGLPHGAYFGVAALVAASLVPPDRRGRAVARVMLGLMVANLVGVPLATVLGQQLGWRSTYWSVAVMGLVALVAVARLVPVQSAGGGSSARQELAALRRPQVLLTLLVGAIGFGGFFAVYSYISPLLTEYAGMREAAIPLVLALFGLGMTVGTEIGGRLADRSVLGTLYAGMTCTVLVLLSFPLAAQTVAGAALACFLLSLVSASSLPALQTRLMDMAGDAQSLAAAGNHASLNVGNALGAALGGVVLAAGLGYAAPAVVGAGLGVVGLGVLTLSRTLSRSAAARG